jgi:K+-transporting ATPase KdpF subunit
MRPHLKGTVMLSTLLLVLTVLVTAFLFGYLLVALLRPEWF